MINKKKVGLNSFKKNKVANLEKDLGNMSQIIIDNNTTTSCIADIEMTQNTNVKEEYIQNMYE